MPLSTHPDIIYRPLGRAGRTASAMGLGGWHLALPQDDEWLAIRLVHMTIDLGINFLDNCWDYSDGDSAFLHRLREATAAHDIRVLLLSSTWSAAERATGLQFDACLHKPVSQSQLSNAISNLVTGNSRETIRFRPLRQKSLQAWKILIAEDNDINQVVTTKILASVGYECEVAENGKQALEALTRATYDLVLMDCQMPEMDGFEATKRFREQEQASESKSHPVPIIALTANALGGDRQRCLDAGMTDYLSKPIDPLKLIDLLDEYLNEVKQV